MVLNTFKLYSLEININYYLIVNSANQPSGTGFNFIRTLIVPYYWRHHVCPKLLGLASTLKKTIKF